MDIDLLPGLADSLVSGGDSRLALDPSTGLNQYFCPARPVPGWAIFSSCTASPISAEGFAAAETAWHRIARSGLAAEAARIAARLRALLGLDGLGEVLLTPSGTDATLLALGLLAAEQQTVPLVSILVEAAETGSGVPLAAAGRHFSDVAGGLTRVAAGTAVAGFAAGTQATTIALRAADGTLRPADEVDRAFAAAVAAAPGRPVVHLMHGSKTGLLAPARVPAGAEVIVDACQMRLPPARLRDYLGRGWLVLITGSKFFGGPPFSGAVLAPRGRLPARPSLPAGLTGYGVDASAPQPAANLGTVLRWAAALAEMERFFALPAAVALGRLAALGEVAALQIAATPGLAALPASAAGDWPATVHAFAMADGRDWANMATLRRVHRALTADGVLIGQPVALGAEAAALRVALGARSVWDDRAEAGLVRVFTAVVRAAELAVSTA